MSGTFIPGGAIPVGTHYGEPKFLHVINDFRIRTFDRPILVGDRIHRNGRVVIAVRYEGSKAFIVTAPEEMVDADWWKRVYNGEYQ